nr:hypothetical protein [uncultured Marinifilum sp.]
MKKVLLLYVLIKFTLVGFALEKKLGTTSYEGKWVKIAKIQNRYPIDGAEFSQFSGSLNIQVDYGTTGSAQYYAIFSFGSRGGIKPMLFEIGDASRRDVNDPSRVEWRIYKSPEGYHYLWMWQSNYCRYAVFDYQATGSEEFWVYENPPSNYQLIWESITGDRQSFNVPIKSPYVEGNMGVGIKNPTHKFEVNGTIRAKEIKVEADWADFVFEDNYQLMKLSDLENYINENGHLPEIPTEKEVEENGVSLGEMNSKLLQKIEELTIHMIQKDKEIYNLKQRLQHLEIVIEKQK